MRNQGLTFFPRFVPAGGDAYQQFQWKTVKSEIRTPEGELVFSMESVTAPQEWSQVAIDVAASKYLRKSGEKENSIRQLVHRVAHTIRRAGEEQGGYFATTGDAEQFEKELAHILLAQKGAFNSPVWFNCGVYERPQCSACFIQSIQDNLSSIFELLKKEALVFKYGSGSGTNFSPLRGKQERLSNGGFSSGLISFLEIFDRAAGATKSGGTTRRAAKMVCLDINHPEIANFIRWKQDEEAKAKVLIAAGFSDDFNGEAYRTVSGQNSNNSVRVSAYFMQALESNGIWQTKARTDGQVIDTYQARELWHMIGEAAWSCADPGLQFDDHIQAWHTCPSAGKINASNPCSEYMFLDDTACNLASVNLLKFLSSDGTLDIDDFRHTCRILFVAQDILVGLASYPTLEITENSRRFRPLGLGYANLGALLMVKGLPYDSPEARSWAGAITALMTGEAYRTSTELAATLGPFGEYAKNQKSMLGVIDKHRQAARKLNSQIFPTELNQVIQQIWQEVADQGRDIGFRNSQATAIAPTGTIGLLMDCDTSGIEPDFSLVKFKKLAGGGHFTIVNQSVAWTLRNLGYSHEQTVRILGHITNHSTIEEAPHLNKHHLPVFDCASSGHGIRFIRPEAHIEMMAAVQPFLSGAISKTVNLPNESTVEDVLTLYLRAWQLGLKSVAIYRDGCKLSQPLNRGKTKPKVAVTDSPSSLPEALLCPICRYPTELRGSCYHCTNCGHSLGCS